MGARIDRNWTVSSDWVEAHVPSDLPPKKVASLEEMLRDVPGDAEVQHLTADLLRALLEPHKRLPRTRIAKIVDKDRRVTYRVWVGRGEGRVWLQRLEVIPDDEDPDPKVFRVPVQALADRATHLLMEEEAVDPEQPESVVIIELEAPEFRPGDMKRVPTAEELREMVRAGMKRSDIQERLREPPFSREVSLSRVDEMLRLARRDRKDLDWPVQRRGPKPTTDGTRPSGIKPTRGSE